MTIAASFKKNSRSEVRVSVEEFHGHDVVNIRVWYTADNGEMRPGKQGLAVRLELLPTLIQALNAAESYQKEVAA